MRTTKPCIPELPARFRPQQLAWRPWAARLALLVSLALPASSSAAVIQWLSAADGNWADGVNWSGGSVPGVTDVAEISVDGTFTVTLDSSVTVAGLILGGGVGTQSLAVNGVGVTIDGAIDILATGHLVMNNASLGGSGVLSLAGTLEMNGGVTVSTAATVSGLLRIRGTGNELLSNVASLPGSIIRVDPSTANVHSALRVATGFTNHGLIELTNTWVGNRDSKLEVTTGTLVNASDGTISSSQGTSSAGTRTLTAELQNLGLFDVKHPLLMNGVDADHTNSGDIVLTGGGSLTLTQSGVDPTFTHTGTIQLSAGRVMTIQGGTCYHDPGTTSGAGTLRCEGVALVGVTHAAGSVELLLAGGNTVDVLSNSGIVTARNAANEVLGTLTALSGSVLRIDPGTQNVHSDLRVATGFTNHGLIELTNTWVGNRESKFEVTTGTLVNASDGTISSSQGTSSAGTRTLTAEIQNHGDLDVRHPLLTNGVDADHVNSGDIVLTGGGSLTLTQSGVDPTFTHTGTIQLSAGRVMTIQGGTCYHDPGTTSGAGTLRCEGVTLVGVTHAAGSVELLLAGGNTVDVLSNSGIVTARNVGNEVLGTFTALSGSVLRIDPGTQNVHSALRVATGFTNHGLIELTNTWVGNRDSKLEVTTGTLVNASDGTISSSQGTSSAGTRTLTAELQNQGLFDVKHPLLMNEVDADHTNSGDIVLTAGGSLILEQTGPGPTLTHSGTIQLSAGRVMTIRGGTFYHNPGSTSGDGTLRCENVRLINVTHGADAATLLLAGGNNLDVLTNSGMVIGRGLNNNIAFCSMDSTATLRVDPSTENVPSDLIVSYGFANHGLIELTNTWVGNQNAKLVVTAGTLVNASDGMILASQGTSSAGSRTLDAELQNQGLVDVKHPLVIAHANADHSNSGDIVLTDGGSLTLTQSGVDPSFTHSGTIQLAAGRIMKIQGGTFYHDPGTTAGAGTLRCEGVSLIGVTHGVGSAELMLAGSNTVDDLENQGTVLVRDIDNLILGSLTTLPGSVLRVDPGSENVPSALRTTNGFVNHGEIELTNTWVGNQNSRLEVMSGDLINANDGRIVSSPGSFGAGSRSLDASVENWGSLELAHSLLVATGPLANRSGGLVTGNKTLNASAVSYVDDGTTSPGLSPGTLTLSGDDPRGPTSALNIEIGGTAASLYDRLAVADTAWVRGAVNITFVNGFEPALGDSFAILTAGTRLGSFDVATGLLAPNGLKLSISYKEDRVDLLAGEAGENTPPTAVDDSVSVGEDLFVDIDVLLNDLDADGDSISVVPGTFSNPPNGFVLLNLDLTIRYQPNPNFAGVDSFTYVISDHQGGDAVGQVFVDVLPRNDAPYFSRAALPNTNLVVFTDEIVEFAALAADIDDGDQVLLTAADLPAGSTVTPALPASGNPVLGTFSWTPTELQTGLHEVSFFATDDSLAQATLVVTIDVRAAVSSTPELPVVAETFRLEPPRPNPASGPVNLDYALPESGRVTLTVYDVQGREVARLVDAVTDPGRHSVAWDGRALGRRVAAGVYLARLQGPSGVETQRVVIAR